jgi:hypothetical protein
MTLEVLRKSHPQRGPTYAKSARDARTDTSCRWHAFLPTESFSLGISATPPYTTIAPRDVTQQAKASNPILQALTRLLARDRCPQPSFVAIGLLLSWLRMGRSAFLTGVAVIALGVR